MKEVIATEEVLNEAGYIIAVRYWYRDGTYTEKKTFIPPREEKPSSSSQSEHD